MDPQLAAADCMMNIHLLYVAVQPKKVAHTCASQRCSEP